MAYNKAVQQRIFNDAMAFRQGMGGRASDADVREWLEERHQPRTPAEHQAIDRLAIRSGAAMELGARMTSNPGTRPRESSYRDVPVAYAGQERYEYRVVVRDPLARRGDEPRGYYVVTSDDRMTGQEVMDAVTRLIGEGGEDVPYRDILRPGLGGDRLRIDVLAAIRYTS